MGRNGTHSGANTLDRRGPTVQRAHGAAHAVRDGATQSKGHRAGSPSHSLRINKRLLTPMPDPVKITRQSLADNAVEQWRNQYPDPGFKLFGGRVAGDVLEQLVALGPHPDPDAVDRIIDNRGWTRIMCDGCGEYPETVVQVGAEPDYESHTACLCVPCLKKALAIV